MIVLLLFTGTLLLRRGNVDRVPASEPLAQFPNTIDHLDSTELPLDAGTLETLGKGIFLSRLYKPAGPVAAAAPPITLFIAYFPTQRSGQSIHSPQNCLPGAGWSFEASGTIAVDSLGVKPMKVGEYLISNGVTRAEVLYWYQAHGRVIANDYKAKLYMLTDSIRLDRTDAALVRIVTPIEANEPRALARSRALAFAKAISPVLPSYIPD